MSLNSLTDQMSRRAASMAEMAKSARNPQEIQAIQQRLVAEVQSGAVKPYIGVPLIQELTNKLAAAKAQAAQAMAGAGIPQVQGGAPIASQVMAQAGRESQGVPSLQSNLPQEYAGGGIIAFEHGGPVQHFQDGGTPISRWWGGIKQNFDESNQAAELRNKIGAKYGPASAVPGLFMNQTDAERQAAKDVMGRLDSLTLPQLQALYAQGTTALPPVAAAPTPAPIVQQGAPMPPPAANQPPAPPPAANPGIGGAGNGFKMPTLTGMKEVAAPTLMDYSTIIGDMPEKTKKASEEAVSATQKELEGFDKPGFEAREGKLSQREASLEKDAAISRALSLMSLGFGIAGSKERTLAGALGNEGRQGIADLIKGEAANRAAKDRLDDARDNFEQQKVAAKKGNYQAAQAAGKDAANDLRAATQFTMMGAHYGNSEALQRHQTTQQGEFQRASLEQSGKLGIAGLGLQAQQLAQTGAFQNKQLEAMDKRYSAMDKQAQARMQQVRAKAFNDFNTNIAPQLNAQFIKEYGPNWRTGTDPRSLQAQMMFKQQQNTYLMDAIGTHADNMYAKDSSDL